MKLFLLLGLALASAACKQEVGASVLCKVVDGPAAECTVTRTKGDAEFEVCWNFKVTCQNNATLEAAKTCGTVKGAGATMVTTPADKIKISGPCDTVKTAVVTDMTINGEAAK